MSVYDPKGFTGRVNYAAQCLVTGRVQGRTFSGCFEMLDGDYVVEALRRRAVNNPRLAAGIKRHLAPGCAEEMEKLYGHLSRTELKREALAYAERIRKQWEAERTQKQQEAAQLAL